MSEFLVRYDAARKALAEAVRVDEVKDIRDKAEAMRVYAEQAKDAELIQYATEIRKRAEIRAGELLKEMAESGERAKSGDKESGRSKRPLSKATLSDFKLTKSQSSRWQQMAALPKQEQEEMIERAKEAAARSVEKPMKVVSSKSNPKKQRRTEISDAKKQAMAQAILDDGKPRPQVAAEFGVSEGTVSAAVAKEEGRREPVIEVKALPFDDQERLKAAIELEKRRLEASFEQAVLDEVKRRIDELVLPHYNKQAAEHRQIIEARKGVMNRKQYLLIASCLHPDQSASEERMKEAFIAFTTHELVLCAEKEMPTTAAPIPRTYEEMMERRNEVKAKRKRQSNGVAQRAV